MKSLGCGEMRNFYLLEAAVNYIEDRLCDSITVQDVADACCFSLSGMQKLFRYALHHGIKEYIGKRRLTMAARDLVSGNGTVMEIAMRYQYNSPEVFARAFKRMWDVQPSLFRETWRFTGLFPRLDYQYHEGDDPIMARKRVDISQAYEMFKSLEGTYVVCFDIIGLMPMNELSSEAGDKAILETAKRIDTVADDDMLVMRIGGDEFALVTGKTDAGLAEQLMNNVLASNGHPIQWNGKEIPLSIRAGITQIHKDHLRYSELFNQMHHAIDLSRKGQIME